MRTLIAELSFRFIYLCNMSRGEAASMERETARLDLCSRCAEKREAEGWAVEVEGEAEGTHKCDLCGYLTPEGAHHERQAHERAMRAAMRGRPYDGRDFDTILEEHMREVRARKGNP